MNSLEFWSGNGREVIFLRVDMGLHLVLGDRMDALEVDRVIALEENEAAGMLQKLKQYWREEGLADN